MFRVAVSAEYHNDRDRMHDSGAGPLAGAGATLVTQEVLETRDLLVENAEVSTPELVVVDGAQLRPGREALGEAGDVVDLQLRPRHVGRVAALRGGQHERLGGGGVR